MNLKNIFQFVSPQVREAALKTAAQLEKLGIRHVLAGGLAVGAHGYVRATSDVDFLVGEEAFVHHGLIVTFREGVPIEVDGIRIDYLSPAGLGLHMEAVLDHPSTSEDIPVVPIEALIYMKLKASRRRDLLDVVELIKAGNDLKRVREYLRQHTPELLPKLEELVKEGGEL